MLTKYLDQSTTLAKMVYNRLLNAQCIYCFQDSVHNICQDCMAAMPILGVHCPLCSEPNQHGQVCGHCIKLTPAFNGVICPFEYRPPLSNLIHHWKDHEQTLGIEQLIQCLADNLQMQSFDWLIPVPYYWGKLMLRGHNPVRELSKKLSQQLNTPILDAIKRIKPGHSQQGLSRQQRLSNLKQLFTLTEKCKTQLQHKNILLVDDVLTTGATCNHISKLLKVAGAHSVTVACLARTPTKG